MISIACLRFPYIVISAATKPNYHRSVAVWLFPPLLITFRNSAWEEPCVYYYPVSVELSKAVIWFCYLYDADASTFRCLTQITSVFPSFFSDVSGFLFWSSFKTELGKYVSSLYRRMVCGWLILYIIVQCAYYAGHGSLLKLRQFHLPRFASVYSPASEYEGTCDGLASCPRESVQLHSNCLR